MNHAPLVKDVRRKSLRILITLMVFAGVLGVTASCTDPGNDPPMSASAAAELNTLLNEGNSDTTAGYYQATSSALVAASVGALNSNFYDLGELLVKDGLSNTIIELGREMNGSWYEWSEQRAPPSEPDAFILAWRQVVTTLRSVPGQHFKFLWTAFQADASVAEAWPGSAYVDYIGTDLFDWYGGPDGTYPLTEFGALDHERKWQEILNAEPGGLNWMAALSQVTGKPIIIPEWGLDFHSFGGQDDPLFMTNMMAWMKAHDAIGLYWEQGHVSPASTASGPLLANEGGSAQTNSPGSVNALGNLIGGRLQYAGVYLPDSQWLSDSVDQPLLAPWEHAGYQLILSVPVVPNPPAIPSYSGPPQPGGVPYALADYPDAVAALRTGSGTQNKGVTHGTGVRGPEFKLRSRLSSCNSPPTSPCCRHRVRQVGIAAHIARLRAVVGHELVLLPSVSVLPVDQAGRVLLVRHAGHEDGWGVLGGAVDVGESPAAAAVREAREEIGASVQLVRLVDVLGGPDYEVRYPNGDRTAYVTAVYEARIIAGSPASGDGELSELAWFTPGELPGLQLNRFSRALFRATGRL